MPRDRRHCQWVLQPNLVRALINQIVASKNAALLLAYSRLTGPF